MARKQWIAVAVIAALIVIPVGLKLARDDTHKAVDVEHVSLRALTPTVLASGALTYESQVTLAPEAARAVIARWNPAGRSGGAAGFVLATPSPDSSPLEISAHADRGKPRFPSTGERRTPR